VLIPFLPFPSRLFPSFPFSSFPPYFFADWIFGQPDGLLWFRYQRLWSHEGLLRKLRRGCGLQHAKRPVRVPAALLPCGMLICVLFSFKGFLTHRDSRLPFARRSRIPAGRLWIAARIVLAICAVTTLLDATVRRQFALATRSAQQLRMAAADLPTARPSAPETSSATPRREFVSVPPQRARDFPFVATSATRAAHHLRIAPSTAGGATSV
jgi:hypothetical protein